MHNAAVSDYEPLFFITALLTRSRLSLPIPSRGTGGGGMQMWGPRHIGYVALAPPIGCNLIRWCKCFTLYLRCNELLSTRAIHSVPTMTPCAVVMLMYPPPLPHTPLLALQLCLSHVKHFTWRRAELRIQVLLSTQRVCDCEGHDFEQTLSDVFWENIQLGLRFNLKLIEI